MAGGDADRERFGRDVPGDDRAGGDERPPTDRNAREERGVRADRDVIFEGRAGEVRLPTDGVGIVREYRARPDEDLAPDRVWVGTYTPVWRLTCDPIVVVPSIVTSVPTSTSSSIAVSSRTRALWPVVKSSPIVTSA